MPYKKNSPKDMREPIWNVGQFSIKDFARVTNMPVNVVYELCSKKSIAPDERAMVNKLIAAIETLKAARFSESEELARKYCQVCSKLIASSRRCYCSNKCQKKAWNLKLKILRGLNPDYGRSGKGRSRD